MHDPNADAPAAEGSFSTFERKALPAEDAYRILAGEDRRPLLVLRECFFCNGTDDALLSTTQDNEKTFLLSEWFHCIKLAPDTLEPNHPFRNLFPADDPSHLFVASWNGRHRLDLKGDQSRTELWDVMGRLIDEEYERDHERSLKKLEKLVLDFDLVDTRIAQLEDRVDEFLEEEGPGSRRLKRVQKELAEAREEREELLAERDALRELGLRPTPDEPPAAAGD